MNSKQNVVTYKVMVAGYIDATARLDQATRRGQPVEASAALFEALNWAVTLDDRIRTQWLPDGEPLGWSWRDRIPNTDVMRAVRFVRNRVHHQWADAMVIEERAQTWPSAVREWKWRAADDLPPSDEEHADGGGEADYRKLLEGRPLALALDGLAGVFYTIQILLEPHTLPAAWRRERLEAT